MINWILLITLTLSSAQTNPFSGYDFGQQYSRIRIFEYDSYSDVKLLKFNIHGPTTVANWSITLTSEGKCPNDFRNIHFYLQQGTYPLVAPRNESFPQTYITKRHNLFQLIFNQTLPNSLIQLNNPLIGTWFALAFVEQSINNIRPKILTTGCNFYLSTWLDYQVFSNILTFALNEPLQIVLRNNQSSIYASYYTSTGNSRISISSVWSDDCQIVVYTRINALPNAIFYDYKTVCRNTSCLIDLDQFSEFVWIYFQITVENPSCLTTPLRGAMLLRSTECLQSPSTKRCIHPYPTRRIMFNYYYDFLYVPIYTNSRLNSGSTSSITLNEKDYSLYSYQFVVDDRNIGGTLHFDFESRLLTSTNAAIDILGCISKSRARLFDHCEDDYQIRIEKNSLLIRSLPYPEMGHWYLTLQYTCNGSATECQNNSVSLMFQISSSQCTKQQCGGYGVCRIMTSQQNVFSTCSCLGGYRGYGCTDDSHAHTTKNLSNVLFLTLSNLMFVPAIILAVYRHLYIEALVYFFNMFFSTFYHACDQDINKFCIFKYDGLQLSDFIGSYASFVITLITMAIIPRTIKVFLFVLGLLTCIVINSRDRFDNLQFIYLISITFSFTIITWITISIRSRRLQPSAKRLLLVMPGFLLAFSGLILFAFCETDENYWYTHSLWHMLIAGSILFFLPHKGYTGKKKIRKSSETDLPLVIRNKAESATQLEPTTASIVIKTTDSPIVENVQQTIGVPIDNTSLSSSNTDSSKKSTDNLLH